jgi:hypothetical protein
MEMMLRSVRGLNPLLPIKKKNLCACYVCMFWWGGEMMFRTRFKIIYSQQKKKKKINIFAMCMFWLDKKHL